MCSKGFQLVSLLFVLLSLSLSSCQENVDFTRMPIEPPPRRPPPELVNNNPGGWGGGFMNTARGIVASPAGQMAVQMAKEYVSRSYGGNQVLSLNLTSLLIVVMLKALIFSTGILGAGNWGSFGRGRVLEGNSIVDNAEMNLFIGFLAAEGSRSDGCLYRAVCMSPEHGSEYMKAGQALLQGFGIFDPMIPENQRYNEYLQNIQQAVLEGMQNAPCDSIYSCNI